MSIKRGATTPCALKGTKQSHVTSLLEIEQEGLGDTRNFLGLVHELFLPYCALFSSRE